MIKLIGGVEACPIYQTRNTLSYHAHTLQPYEMKRERKEYFHQCSKIQVLNTNFVLLSDKKY